MRKINNKKGQLAIFVIIAILIAGTVLFFVFKDKIFLPSDNYAELNKVYELYDSCIAEETKAALDLAGTQGGRIDTGEFMPGSDYAPFSSHLNFLGFGVPYWYYISGNGLIKEQVPKKQQIENEIAKFIAEGIKNCNFKPLYSEGYSINLGEPDVKVAIGDSSVVVDVNALISASKNNNSASKTKHHIDVPSNFGKLYSAALSFYEAEKNNSYLENYAEDVLRLYAPVDGMEASCSPKVWKTREVAESIKSGLEANLAHVKLKGNYYKLQSEEDKYFVINKNVGATANFMYSKEWPMKIEISGADEELMIAQPIGNQEGLGILGFCYVPYHFVYDLSFPVLVQLSDGDSLFQFPIVVIIDKNVPRKALVSEISADKEEDVCKYNTQDLQVNIYNTELQKVDANVSYICFDQECRLGESNEGTFIGKAPACLNGYLKLRTEGYSEKKQVFSTNKEGSIDVIMDKEYLVELELNVGSKPLNGNAIISFAGEKSISTSLPENKNISLAEGYYNLSVYVYGNSTIVIPASTRRQCTEVAKPGVLGLFGGTREQCFDINLPEASIESALIGGGKSDVYLFSSDLKKGKLIINVDSFAIPNSIDKLQYNYALFDGSGVTVEAHEN